MQNLITDTVIGAALGSFITLIGVWLTNKYQQKAREEEREYKLKSEIFMEAAEQLVRMKMLLFKIPNITEEQMNSASAEGVSTAKLTVIASNETVQAVLELSAAIGTSLLQLLPEKLPLDDLRTDVDIISSEIDGSFQKQNQMLNEMTAYNLRGKSDPVFWKKLQDNFEYYSSQIDSLVNERKEKQTKLNRLTKELHIKCIEAALKLSDLEVKAISHVRKELNMPFDEIMYRRTVEESNRRMESEFSKFLVRIPDAS